MIKKIKPKSLFVTDLIAEQNTSYYLISVKNDLYILTFSPIDGVDYLYNKDSKLKNLKKLNSTIQEFSLKKIEPLLPDLDFEQIRDMANTPLSIITKQKMRKDKATSRSIIKKKINKNIPEYENIGELLFYVKDSKDFFDKMKTKVNKISKLCKYDEDKKEVTGLVENYNRKELMYIIDNKTKRNQNKNICISPENLKVKEKNLEVKIIDIDNKEKSKTINMFWESENNSKIFNLKIFIQKQNNITKIKEIKCLDTIPMHKLKNLIDKLDITYKFKNYDRVIERLLDLNLLNYSQCVLNFY